MDFVQKRFGGTSMLTGEFSLENAREEEVREEVTEKITKEVTE
jgi:hypothetical protein